LLAHAHAHAHTPFKAGVSIQLAFSLNALLLHSTTRTHTPYHPQQVAAALFAEAILAEGFQGQPLGMVLVSEQLVAAGLSLFFHPTSAYVLGTTAEVRSAQAQPNALFLCFFPWCTAP